MSLRTARTGRTVKKRALSIGGRRTSLTLEDRFWKSLREIADERGLTIGGLVQLIDTHRTQGNLSSAVCLFVLQFYQDRVAKRDQQAAPAYTDASRNVRRNLQRREPA